MLDSIFGWEYVSNVSDVRLAYVSVSLVCVSESVQWSIAHRMLKALQVTPFCLRQVSYISLHIHAIFKALNYQPLSTARKPSPDCSIVQRLRFDKIRDSCIHSKISLFRSIDEMNIPKEIQKTSPTPTLTLLVNLSYAWWTSSKSVKLGWSVLNWCLHL